MPRFTAPPPSGEVSINLTQPFNGTPTKKIEIFGEPNRSASIKVHTDSGSKDGALVISTGDINKDDFESLLGGLQELRGLPSDPNSDIYGFDTRLVLTTFDIQWDNGEDVEGTEATAENKQMFKDVVDRIEELGRKYAH